MFGAGNQMSPETAIEDTEVAILARVLEAQNGNLTPAAAESWLKLRLPEADEKRLVELSAKAKADLLAPDEKALLENYLHVGRLVDLMKSKARLSLKPR
jgi:hypothetical protein